MERHTATGWGLCPEHQKLADDGFVALVECDPHRSGSQAGGRMKPEQAYRTGRLAHLRRTVFAQVFNVPIADEQACVDVVTPRATTHQRGEELAQAVGLDMAAWWKPTAKGYFKHVSKAVILEAVGEYAPEQVTRLTKLKKADIASEAERLVDGTGWMPAIFKAAGPQEVAQEAGPEQDAPEDADAVTDEPAEALAA